MVTGKTKNGFKFSYDERILNDWRFVSAIAETQSDNDAKKLKGATAMVEMLLGADGVKALSDFIAKKNDGFVPVEAMMAEITAIMESSKIIKN